jgi:hypothetical protein
VLKHNSGLFKNKKAQLLTIVTAIFLLNEDMSVGLIGRNQGVGFKDKHGERWGHTKTVQLSCSMGPEWREIRTQASKVITSVHYHDDGSMELNACTKFLLHMVYL